MTDLLRETDRVDSVVCPTPVEAAVREVRLIHACRPRYNARSKTPERGVYLRLTAETWPRLSVVREAREDGGTYLGPLRGRRAAERVADALHDVAPIRRCADRIGPRTRFAPCALKGMGRCLAPCDGTAAPGAYAEAVAAVAAAMAGDAGPALALLDARMRALAADARFEHAADARDRLRALALAVDRSARLRRTAAPARIVAAGPVRGAGRGGRGTTGRSGRGRRAEVLVASAGMLVATATCAPDEGRGDGGAAARRRTAGGRPRRGPDRRAGPGRGGRAGREVAGGAGRARAVLRGGVRERGRRRGGRSRGTRRTSAP